MSQSKWIWYPGDYEIYHSNLLHARREDFGVPCPSMWKLHSPYPRVDFYKTVVSPEPRTFRFLVNDDSTGQLKVEGVPRFFGVGEEITLPAGTYRLILKVCNIKGGLPCAFLDDPYFGTDETWQVTNATYRFFPAACTPAYRTEAVTPQTFPFVYEPLEPVSVEQTEEGTLYDFGRETFGPVTLSGMDAADTVCVTYGESREEALSWENAYVRERITGKTQVRMPPRAFRFLHVRSTGAASALSLKAEYEYLPLKDVGRFSCDDPEVEKIWQVCAYTFHLNSRECYMDGIKRDRWVWSGDSYQSFMINNYLYMDPEITKRTILALLGKPPYEQHINTITDYTMYLLISIRDYYYSSGDQEFVKFVWPRAKALYQFLAGRLDENGQVVQRPGDWIFVDWSEIDRDGPLSAEQILLWKTHTVMAFLAALCGEDGEIYLERAEKLKTWIDAHYWDEEKQAYIDNYVSGLRNVTRHANIFAILYDFASPERKQQILEHVLNNDKITQITTPYFKFYELCAQCSMGGLAAAQKLLTEYWGGMLRAGATSVWEQFDPNVTGAAHYGMYDEPFGCSLCHAWGGGPVYFLGRFCLGVRAENVAYRKFRVAPQPGIYQEIHGVVPLPGGSVQVDLENGTLKILTDCEGGVAEAGGKEYPLIPGEVLTVSL